MHEDNISIIQNPALGKFEDISKIFIEIVWTALIKNYGWIYATPTPQAINLNCPEKLQITIHIQNVGILQTEPECKIKSMNLPHLQNKNLIFLDKSMTLIYGIQAFLFLRLQHS